VWELYTCVFKYSYNFSFTRIDIMCTLSFHELMKLIYTYLEQFSKIMHNDQRRIEKFTYLALFPTADFFFISTFFSAAVFFKPFIFLVWIEVTFCFPMCTLTRVEPNLSLMMFFLGLDLASLGVLQTHNNKLNTRSLNALTR
jgi:hypothetical protein